MKSRKRLKLKPGRINLTGRRFGKLKVIKPARGVKRSSWICKCDCGRLRTALTGSLRRGRAKTCLHCRDLARYSDWKGRRFGRLVAVKPIRTVGEHHKSWLCKCDCGRTHVAASNNLVRGRVRSCGCLMQERVPMLKRALKVRMVKWRRKQKKLASRRRKAAPQKAQWK